MRLYYLCRREDVSGTSGTGHVAEVAEFDDGTVVVRWIREMNAARVASTTVFSCLHDLLRVHGHDGKTRVEQIVDTSEIGRLPEAVRDLSESLRLAVDSLKRQGIPIPARVLEQLGDTPAEPLAGCFIEGRKDRTLERKVSDKQHYDHESRTV